MIRWYEIDSEGYQVASYAGPQPGRDNLVAMDESEAPAQRAGVPKEVSKFGAKAVLMQDGLLDQVKALMQDPEMDPMAVLAWEEAPEFERQSVFINSLAPALGLTEPELDDMFRRAAKIRA